MLLNLSTLLVGSLLGLALGAAIVFFLVYAAINAARLEEDQPEYNGSSVHWSPIARYETKRSHLHVLGHDPDSFDW